MAQPNEDMHTTGPSETTVQQGNDDDNSPMVYVTPSDYGSWAREHRKELENQGKEVVLESELPQLVGCRGADESPAAYAQRYTDTVNAMIRRGVSILNDQTTHDQVPDVFFMDGHEFDVGPESGITKKEYREFNELFGRDGLSYADIPERFRRFEVVKPDEEV